MKSLSSYLQYLSLGLISIFILVYPLTFTTLTTDSFVVPKQLLLAGVTLVVLLFWGVKNVIDKQIVVRRTPFDVPVLAFLAVALVGSLLAPNRAESLTSFATLLFATLLYFLFTNTVKRSKFLIIVLIAFLEGAFLSGVFFLLNFFKVYFLPFPITRAQTFTSLGSLLDLAIYTSVALVLGAYLFWFWKEKEKVKLAKLKSKARLILSLFALKLLVYLGILGVSIYSMVRLQNPTIFPFDTGFQVAFASISQDTSRWILSFLLGSGFGTFATDFSRFKLAVFNQTPYWNLTFFRSSSLVLELLATTGVLGFLSYLFIVLRALRTKPLFVPFAFFVLLSFILPVSTNTFPLFFILLGIFAAIKGADAQAKSFFDVQLAMVTLRNGILAVSPQDKREVRHGLSKVLPWSIFIIVLLVVGGLGLLSARYALANKIFQESIIAAKQNKALDTYNKQSQVLDLVSYNDAYRVQFSRTSLTIADNLLKEASKEASPSSSPKTQTAYQLIQSAINNARLATELSPLTAVNWVNLSVIYDRLIGVGKNAEKFAIDSRQRAILLDPTNPIQYLDIGNLYYRLGLYDNAIEQIKMSINLKPGIPNAYYNLSHALQQKGDIKGALDQMEIVKNLVKNDPSNLKKVEAEIDALKAGLSTSAGAQTGTQLPQQTPPVPIPAPATPKPTPTPTSLPQQPLGATPTPTPSPK